MQRRITVHEGRPFTVDAEYKDELRQALIRLKVDLKLSFAPLSEDERGFTIWNLVGSIDTGRLLLEIAPKADHGEDWVASVLALLIGKDAVDASGERAAGQSPFRADLLEALGAAFASRLTKAFRRDGPIMLMARQSLVSTRLKGRLQVSRWLRTGSIEPARFPQDLGMLTADNDFAQALGFVALMFAKSVRRPRVRAALSELAELLRPGLPPPTSAPAGIHLRQLPSQWSVYRPAWSIASAVLARRALLGPRGTQSGVSIAVEPWPLLERLLERSLEAVVALGKLHGWHLGMTAQGNRMILERSGGSASYHHFLIPDGVLFKNGAAIASFEAKYREYSPNSGPREKDIYQALAAARAVGAPLSVLVYPGKFETGMWKVARTGGNPATLAVLGLDMFDYARTGPELRANQIFELLKRPLPSEQKEIMIAS